MPAGAEGRAMRRKLAKPAERPRADAGTGLASLTLTVTAPLVGLRLAGDPSRSTVEPGNGAYLGDVG